MPLILQTFAIVCYVPTIYQDRSLITKNDLYEVPCPNKARLFHNIDYGLYKMWSGWHYMAFLFVYDLYKESKPSKSNLKTIQLQF